MLEHAPNFNNAQMLIQTKLLAIRDLMPASSTQQPQMAQQHLHALLTLAQPKP